MFPSQKANPSMKKKSTKALLDVSLDWNIRRLLRPVSSRALHRRRAFALLRASGPFADTSIWGTRWRWPGRWGRSSGASSGSSWRSGWCRRSGRTSRERQTVDRKLNALIYYQYSHYRTLLLYHKLLISINNFIITNLLTNLKGRHVKRPNEKSPSY